ncbi:prepilin peptidase [Streptobacillus canis]|uniref:prepilin peptidase n=1 Tax=Streptobacillus canis TaxID=2678686 RepID=UPI0012E12761|nr:prepilin peptidase [Streptobacillus canis]
MIFLLYILLTYISYVDLKEGYIYDRDLIFLFILILILKQVDYYSSYIGMGIFTLPFFFFWLIESYINIEIIGMGDIKLMLVFGMYFGMRDIYFLLRFYEIMYISALIYGLILRKRYIPFAPAMCVSFILHDLRLI